jgi:hypothetical protein
MGGDVSALLNPIRAEVPVAPHLFSSLRKHAMLEGCKWDPQVGDVETLSPFPLVMSARAWSTIASLAEQLTQEAIAAEEEISCRPDLLDSLGLPRALSHALAAKTPATPAAGRVTRFDFHFTSEGWRISEANSDVPGGFSEASYFTAMMGEHYPHLRPAGNPGNAWSDALAKAAAPSGVVALLSAPGYMEDHQVISFLAARLRERGCNEFIAKPEQIYWRDGLAYVADPIVSARFSSPREEAPSNRRPVEQWIIEPHVGSYNTDVVSGLVCSSVAADRIRIGAIVRFYQAEWLSRLPESCGWRYFFRGGNTPVANPPLAVISESKRFPLVWNSLSTILPTWRALLPETRDPTHAPWSRDDSWLLKTAMCNTGDTVSMRELMQPTDWLRTRIAARLLPSRWVAQRRFDSVPVLTPAGLRHVCIGVFTLNGRAAGAYARMSRKPLIDFEAIDAALLLHDDD